MHCRLAPLRQEISSGVLQMELYRASFLKLAPSAVRLRNLIAGHQA